MSIHQTHTHRHTHTLPIWWIWAGRQGIKLNRRINLNDLWKILVMAFMNTLWNIENVVINFDVRKWGRNIKQTALNFEQGLHVISSELTESEGRKDWGTRGSTLSCNSYSEPDNMAEKKLRIWRKQVKIPNGEQVICLKMGKNDCYIIRIRICDVDFMSVSLFVDFIQQTNKISLNSSTSISALIC